VCHCIVDRIGDFSITIVKFSSISSVRGAKQQYVRLTVGHVKAETKIVKRSLDPEWNQVFAVGEDKVQGGTLELTVWDAVWVLTLG
jgi:Ca2+-dependent lipid-binding protein